METTKPQNLVLTASVISVPSVVKPSAERRILEPPPQSGL